MVSVVGTRTLCPPIGAKASSLVLSSLKHKSTPEASVGSLSAGPFVQAVCPRLPVNAASCQLGMPLRQELCVPGPFRDLVL